MLKMAAENTVSIAEYNMLSTSLERQFLALVNNYSIARELSNKIIISTLNKGDFEHDYALSSTQVRAAADKYIQGLSRYCYVYALKLTSNPEFSKDIAQETMIELLKNIENVEFVKAWLKGTLSRKVLVHWKNHIKDDYIIKKLKEDELQLHQNLDETVISRTLSNETIMKLLDEEQYLRYKHIKSFPNLKEYAKFEGISYYTARKHNHVIRRNIKAAYLKSQDWNAGSEMLSFKQYDNLRRFMKALIEYSNNNELEKMIKYCSRDKHKEISRVIAHIKKIYDWGIETIEKDLYNIALVDDSDFSYVAMITVKLPQKGTIKITAGTLLKTGEKLQNPHKKKIPVLDKGYIGMTLDELKAYMLKKD